MVSNPAYITTVPYELQGHQGLDSHHGLEEEAASEFSHLDLLAAWNEWQVVGARRRTMSQVGFDLTRLLLPLHFASIPKETPLFGEAR